MRVGWKGNHASVRHQDFPERNGFHQAALILYRPGLRPGTAGLSAAACCRSSTARTTSSGESFFRRYAASNSAAARKAMESGVAEAMT